MQAGDGKGKRTFETTRAGTKTSTNFNNKTAAFLSSHNQKNTQLPLKESPVLFSETFGLRDKTFYQF